MDSSTTNTPSDSHSAEQEACEASTLLPAQASYNLSLQLQTGQLGGTAQNLEQPSLRQHASDQQRFEDASLECCSGQPSSATLENANHEGGQCRETGETTGHTGAGGEARDSDDDLGPSRDKGDVCTRVWQKWTSSEQQLLEQLVQQYGAQRWVSIRFVPTQCLRTV